MTPGANKNSASPRSILLGSSKPFFRNRLFDFDLTGLDLRSPQGLQEVLRRFSDSEYLWVIAGTETEKLLQDETIRNITSEYRFTYFPYMTYSMSQTYSQIFVERLKSLATLALKEGLDNIFQDQIYSFTFDYNKELSQDFKIKALNQELVNLFNNQTISETPMFFDTLNLSVSIYLEKFKENKQWTDLHELERQILRFYFNFLFTEARKFNSWIPQGDIYDVVTFYNENFLDTFVFEQKFWLDNLENMKSPNRELNQSGVASKNAANYAITELVFSNLFDALNKENNNSGIDADLFVEIIFTTLSLYLENYLNIFVTTSTTTQAELIDDCRYIRKEWDQFSIKPLVDFRKKEGETAHLLILSKYKRLFESSDLNQDYKELLQKDVADLDANIRARQYYQLSPNQELVREFMGQMKTGVQRTNRETLAKQVLKFYQPV